MKKLKLLLLWFKIVKVIKSKLYIKKITYYQPFHILLLLFFWSLTIFFIGSCLKIDKINTEYQKVYFENQQHKALILAINNIKENRPAIGGTVEDIFYDISQGNDRIGDINNLASTDFAIMVQERIFKNGLYKYSLYKYSYPVPDIDNAFITCEYGDNYYYYKGKTRYRFHEGIDIGCRFDLRIIAVEDGEVVKAGVSKNGYGNYIKIKHPDGNYTLYGHLEEFRVVKGDKVIKGQLIGIMGNTGFSLGRHLHYEIRDSNNKTINPLLNSTYGLDVSDKSVRGVD